MRVFVIAEIGVNHNGDMDLARRLIDEAAAAGADAVKFQTFKADALVSESAPKAAYQTRETGEGSQHAMLRALEVRDEDWPVLIAASEAAGVEFMSTPFDIDSAARLVDLDVKRLKLPSGEVTNHPYLTACAAHGLPLILSTGMADLREIEDAVEVIRGAHPRPLEEVLTILHCTSNYPTAEADVNLRAMTTIAAATGLPVGYSDHTMGIAVSPAAVAMGAVAIEKHMTLDRTMAGPDHKASLEPAEMTAMIAQIRSVEAALGSPVKAPTASEEEMRLIARRSLTLAKPLAKGEVLTEDAIAILRPGHGISPKDLERAIGRLAARDLASGHTLLWEDLLD